MRYQGILMTEPLSTKFNNKLTSVLKYKISKYLNETYKRHFENLLILVSHIIANMLTICQEIALDFLYIDLWKMTEST